MIHDQKGEADFVKRGRTLGEMDRQQGRRGEEAKMIRYGMPTCKLPKMNAILYITNVNK